MALSSSSENRRSIARIGLIAAFLLFDAAALEVGRKPCVPDAYRTFYLDHAMSLNQLADAYRSGDTQRPVCHRHGIDRILEKLGAWSG